MKQIDLLLGLVTRATAADGKELLIHVPEFIASLGNLRYLNLSSSNFSGIIPPQIGNLSNLHVLCLGSFYKPYEFTSMMNMNWLTSLRLLHHLDMSGVALRKATDWLQVINTLPSLVQLHLSNCYLLDINHQLPIFNITSLSLLDLSENYFNSLVPRWIFSITSLVSLDLSACNFRGIYPNSVGFHNLTSLKFLHVRDNDFMNSSLVLEGLSSTVGSNLISLDVSFCGVSSTALNALHNLASLIRLDVSHNQLTKAIPKSLGNFCDLRDIDLSDNNFLNINLRNLLESFFECKSSKLESLTLRSSGTSGLLSLIGNMISGTIPYSIGRLSSLEVLHLSYNQLNGSLPGSIGRLSSLELLYLSHNRLSGNLPENLGQLSKLEELSFSYNLLSGVVTEAHIAKLESLNYLNGTGNNLTLRRQHANWIPPFRIQYLHLNSWGLGPEFPLWLQSQGDLRVLDISNTRISSPIPGSFWTSFPNLSYLDMSQNHIQGALVGVPTTLRVLDLSFNEMRGTLTHISNGSFPLYLDLSNNFFDGSLHDLLCSNDVKKTVALKLGNNELSGVIPECWENWSSLLFLNLENNSFSGEIPRTIGSAGHLESLNIRGNKLLGNLPTSLMNLKWLKILQLGRNELVGSIPAWFGRNLSSLKLLNLRSNNFHGNIPPELCYLEDIQILDLADNNLSGNIPSCVNNFRVLSGEGNAYNDTFTFSPFDNSKPVITSDSLVMKGREDVYRSILGLVLLLDLSRNNFSGQIPSELTALVKLKSLNLSRNQLTGKIPEKIGDMKSLETFDLSLNKLSGELPISMSSLSFLSSFNVSYNNLNGRVPSITQLQSLNESSFFGNRLCGAPLIERCVVEVPSTQNQKEDDDGSHRSDWGLIISIVLGYVSSFWINISSYIKSCNNVYIESCQQVVQYKLTRRTDVAVCR
uniref:Putative leucine-rich repeat protein, plant-type n=1 Tax=Tanacetum cinerariifolium TaxID=118510 RepID=A0A6L2NE06_TANCI|nr:putative leucine-rich repeat protein, plant-type [Tanacetum cinerariifolium]